jgi:hypothetical protein
MYPSVIVLALLGAANGTVYAQGQPQPAPAPNAAPVAPVVTPAPKPQTVKKVVCQRVDNEETTGSRLGSAPKVCKTVEVPVQSGKGERGQR